MKTVEYYTKPTKIEAIQWKGDKRFIDALKDQFHWQQIDVRVDDCAYMGELKSNTVAVITMKFRHVGPFNVEDKTVTIEPNDWLIVDNEGPNIMTDEDFKEEFFAVETEHVVTMPTLESLL